MRTLAEAVFWLCITALFVLFVGTPDLHDILIRKFAPQQHCAGTPPQAEQVEALDPGVNVTKGYI